MKQLMKKLFDEKPLPKGFPNPPEGCYFIGIDKELPRCELEEFMYLRTDNLWCKGQSDYLSSKRPVSEGYVFAPAHLVRRLSTQKRAERRAKQIKPAPTPWSFPLFEHISKEHGLTELSDILEVCKKMIPTPVEDRNMKPKFRVTVCKANGDSYMTKDHEDIDLAYQDAEQKATMLDNGSTVYVCKILSKFTLEAKRVDL
jgi:hypothetical protein